MKGFIKFKDGLHGEIFVYNHKDEFLGYLIFNKRWKKWVFDVDSDTFYDSKCLDVISEKLKQINKQKR